MSERKYTDEQIVKALECCRDFGDFGDCSHCPYENATFADELDCTQKLHTDALALINRLKADVEEWKSNANDWQNQYLKLIEEMEIYQEHIDQDIIYAKAIKAEAIKAFAERLKEERGIAYPFTSWVHIADIDNLVAEMTEGQK